MGLKDISKQVFDIRLATNSLGRKFIASIAQLSLLALVVSCSSSPRDNEESVTRRFSTISIASKEDLVFYDTANIDSPGKTESMVAGGTQGALSGALIGAATCAPTGPYAALCVAAAVVPGAIAGLLTGATAGNEWWFRSSSHEDSLYLKEEVSHATANRDLNKDLAEALINELPDEIIRPALDADIQAIPVIEEITFIEGNENVVGLNVSALLVFSEGNGIDAAEHGHLLFSAASEQRSVDAWLDDDGNDVRNAIDSCTAQIALKMANLIMEKRSP